MKKQTSKARRRPSTIDSRRIEADTARALRLMADQYGEEPVVDYDTVVGTIAEIQLGLEELEKRTPPRWTTYGSSLLTDPFVFEGSLGEGPVSAVSGLPPKPVLAKTHYTAKDAAKMVATQTALYEIRRQLGVALDEVSRDRAELDPYKVGNAYTIGGQS